MMRMWKTIQEGTEGTEGNEKEGVNNTHPYSQSGSINKTRDQNQNQKMKTSAKT